MSKKVMLLALIAAFILAPMAFGATYDEMKAAFNAAQEGQQLTAHEKQLVEQFSEQYMNSGSNDELDESGGPDEYGYAWRDSQEDNGPTYDWIDITDTGTEIIGMGDDDHDGPFDIGFDFPIYDATYSEFYFQSNGTISFQAGYVSLFNYEMPAPNYDALIAWFWDDLNPSGGNGEIYYESTTVDEMDALVISVIDYREYSGSGTLTAQFILFENGAIKLQYQSLDNSIDITSCTIGIQNDGGTIGLSALYNGSIVDYPFNELAIEFYLPEPNVDLSGTVTESRTDVALEGVTVTAGGFTATTDETGYYEMELYDGEFDVTFTHPDYQTYIETMTFDPDDVETLNAELIPAAPPVVGGFFDFEDSDGGFTDESTSTPPWEWGTPSTGPGAAYSGDNCWGTGLDGNYQSANPYNDLISPVFTISTGVDAELSFYMWYDIENGWDDGFLYYRVNGGDWVELETWTGSGDTWTEYTYALDGISDGDEVEFRWLVDGDGSVGYPGMFIDDVTVGGVAEPIGSLAGIVSDGVDPIEGATVDLYEAEGETPLESVTTDAVGGYLFEDLEPGLYDVITTAAGYYENVAYWVSVAAGENTFNITLDGIPVVSIEDIQTTMSDGDWVSTTGIVTLPTNSIHTDRFDAYIQDGSGYGVMLYDSDPVDQGDGLNRGDEVTVTGQITEYNGITELTDFSFEVLSTDNELPDPYTGTTADMAEQQALEGAWATVMGELQEDPGTGSYTLNVDDGSGAVAVRINEDAALDLSDFAMGDWIVFYGPIGLYQDAVQIVPALPEDFHAPILPAPYDMTAEREDGSPLVDLAWEFDDETDDFIEYIIFRNGEALTETDDQMYTDDLTEEDAGTFEYYVVASFDEGMSQPSDTASVEWDGVGVDENLFANVPTEYSIARAYPNPFNPTMTAVVGLPDAADLDVRVYNVLGEQVAVLAQGRHMQGYHQFTFNASELASGIYFIKAVVPGQMNSVKRVTLLR